MVRLHVFARLLLVGLEGVSSLAALSFPLSSPLLPHHGHLCDPSYFLRYCLQYGAVVCMVLPTVMYLGFVGQRCASFHYSNLIVVDWNDGNGGEKGEIVLFHL